MKYILAFTHAQTAHSKAVEGHGIHFPNTLLSKILIHTTLNNPEHQLIYLASRSQTTFSPTDRSRRGIPSILTVRVVGDTFVQHHRDVASEGLLNLSDVLWGKEMIRAVQMRLKANPLFR